MNHCQCLYEIENQLPRTKFCFAPCSAQRKILRSRKSPEASALTKRIHQFVEKYANISPNWNKDEGNDKYTGPDPYQLLGAAFQISRNEEVLQCHSDWGSGCYKDYTDKEAKKLHDDLVADILKFNK